MPSAESPDSLYPAWVRYFGPERESVFDKALDLALDNSGNIYVTGTSDGDYLTVKYTSAGRVSWLAHYAGPAYSNDIATTVAVDNAGNVLVSGFSSGTDGDSDYECLTVKYDSSGNELWVAVYDANTTYTEGYDRVSLGSDSAGSVYLTATNRHFLVRYDADGVELWARQISRAMSVVALALDNAGSVYVSGEGSNTTMDYIATARFNAA
ncbi:MAG TPA: SBBP repeat-containing protein, partial [Calditrichia bacterium]|nr:SBBP repeat-containing protein [Calditrichia bacterium]